MIIHFLKCKLQYKFQKNMLNQFDKEILRKLIHLSSLWVVIVYIFLPKHISIILIAIITIILVYLDLNKKNNTLAAKIFPLFKSIKREHELNGKLTGASYFMIASLIVILIASKPLAVNALLVLIFADSFAALIGKKYGNIIIVGQKTLQGTLAFFISSLIISFIVIYFYSLPIYKYISTIIISMFVTYIELYSNTWKIDDNLLIPISFILTSYLVDFFI